MHDEIVPAGPPSAVPGVARPTNNAGGLEGGVTNGEELRVTGYMKPIATLMKPLRSVDLTHASSRPPRSSAATCAPSPRQQSSARRWSPSCWPTRGSRSSAATPLPRSSAITPRRPAPFTRASPHCAPCADRRLPAMIRPILQYGDPTLHRPAEPVDTLTPELQVLIDDMIDTMYAAPGIGLAAPQVGVPSASSSWTSPLAARRSLIVFVNPEFVEREGMQLEEEGCLSVPGFAATVARPLARVVKGLDRHGTEHVVEGTDLLARAFQHEMDHLDGTLFVDRLRGIKRDMIVRKISKLTRAGKMVDPRARDRLLRHAGVRRPDAPGASRLSPPRSSAVVSQPDRPRGRGQKTASPR